MQQGAIGFPEEPDGAGGIKMLEINFEGYEYRDDGIFNFESTWDVEFALNLYHQGYKNLLIKEIEKDMDKVKGIVLNSILSSLENEREESFFIDLREMLKNAKT